MQDAIKFELQDRSAHLHEQGCVWCVLCQPARAASLPTW